MSFYRDNRKRYLDTKEQEKNTDKALDSTEKTTDLFSSSDYKQPEHLFRNKKEKEKYERKARYINSEYDSDVSAEEVKEAEILEREYIAKLPIKTPEGHRIEYVDSKGDPIDLGSLKENEYRVRVSIDLFHEDCKLSDCNLTYYDQRLVDRGEMDFKENIWREHIRTFSSGFYKTKEEAYKDVMERVNNRINKLKGYNSNAFILAEKYKFISGNNVRYGTGTGREIWNDEKQRWEYRYGRENPIRTKAEEVKVGKKKKKYKYDKKYRYPDTRGARDREEYFYNYNRQQKRREAKKKYNEEYYSTPEGKKQRAEERKRWKQEYFKTEAGKEARKRWRGKR